MPSVTHDDAPLLADLMPWSVAPPRLGRGWPAAPDPASLKARWDALLKAEGADREALFEPTRSRTPHSAVGQLPGHSGGTEKLVRAAGPCPEPVRVLLAPFDEQWLIPDHRLIDAARPELWRVADDRQVYVVESGADPRLPLLATGLLPMLRAGRVRPLFRRPGGLEPNLAPGLLAHLATRLGTEPDAVDVLAWILVAVRPGLTVPLTADPGRWARGVEAGRRMLWLLRRDGERPRLPGGRRPYVRAPLPAFPRTLRYDREEEALYLDEGRVSPVPAAAWDFTVNGVPVLEHWFTARTRTPAPGTLSAVRPAVWPQPWTSELLELITVLSLLSDIADPTADTPDPAPLTATELTGAGVFPVPAALRRPASVLNHLEEGPEGQFALL
ncbi:type ISP restriction/modification enzyme [Streptomyces sp. NPDC047000]|uniref:type ISP restriction/modification enzyme n=1 Tax=Streptomyces sp. NPDC047000 TaxID=3155474 RepID=UPI0033CE4EF7